MNQKIQLLVMIIMTGIPAAFTYPETLGTIAVTGPGKTRPSTIRRIIGCREGDSIAPGSEEVIRQKLLKSGLFVNETVTVRLSEPADGRIDITIHLEDRRTFLPLPILSVSGTGINGGVILAESNLLGTGNQMVTAGQYGTGEQKYLAAFRNPYLFNGDFVLGLSAGYTEKEHINRSVDKNEADSYEAASLTAGATAGWEPGIFRTSVFLDAEWMNTSLSDEQIRRISPKVQLGIDTLVCGPFFTEGFLGTMRFRYEHFTGAFENTRSVSFRGSVLKTAGEKWQIGFEGDGGVPRGDQRRALTPETGVCGTILPTGVLADRYIKGGLLLQPVLLSFPQWYLALPLSWQTEYLDGLSSSKEFFYGPAAGLSLYLKKVAVPALSLIWGMNLENHTGLMRFHLGMQI